MKMNAKWLIPSALVMALSTAVYAQSNQTPGLDKREANQEKRIEQGEKSGQLTPKESRQLERGEKRLKRNEAQAKADGKVTPEERKKLNREANHMSRKIARKKHNGKTAEPGTAH